MGKRKDYAFLETIYAICLKVGLSIQLNELMKLSEYERSRSFFDLGKISLRYQNQKTCFPQKLFSRFKLNIT